MGVQTGIVFVSFIKQLVEEGTELTAVVKAGKLRLRPGIMTTLTTVFGILPMALSRGEALKFGSLCKYYRRIACKFHSNAVSYPDTLYNL